MQKLIQALVLFLGVSGALPAGAQTTGTGVLTGQVIDATHGEALPGALVRIDGTPLSAATDSTGTFRLAGVAAGAQTVIVNFLGRGEARVVVTVVAGAVTRVPAVRLDTESAYREEVTVVGESIQEGQARALNQQRSAPSITNVVAADQIGSFPDPNAAEAVSRIPGVSIERDQGEGRYVLVRGTEARLNSMMIDGERIPAPEGEARQVALDAVPADELQSIEVYKAVTPDMDADSIGGAVNLVTREAVSRMTALFSAAGGYNGLQRDYGQRRFSGTLGGRFANNRVGLLAGFSGSSLNRGSENFEAEYDDGGLDDLQLRDYAIERQRYGINMAADMRLGLGTNLKIKSIFNEFKDYEVNNRIRFRPGNRRIEHVLKNRNQNQHVRSISAGAEHLLAGGATLDYKLAWASAEEEQPDRLDTIFRQTGIDFTPNVSADFIDPENIQPNPSANDPAKAKLNAWENEVFDTTDRDVTGTVNYRMPLATGGTTATFLEAGVKFKGKHKLRNNLATVTEPSGTVLFPQLQDAGFDSDRFLDFFPAGYAPFPGISPSASRALLAAQPAANTEIDHEGDAESYDATERVVAGYVMAELFLGPKLTILPGVRIESTDVDYTGFTVLYDDDGDYVSTEPVTGGDTYTQLMPGFHVRYAVTDATNVRAAYTRTLARPNYYDLVPYQLVFQEDGEIDRGNPALRPTTSNNLDFMVEHYLQSVGVVSGGVFYKRLTDYIYAFRSDETAFGEEYRVTQPRNGESASLWGVELAFQNQLRFLPAPFDGIGLYANYTYTDSTAEFPDRTGTSTLPGQSAHVGNVAVWYEKAGFSGKVSVNLHGHFIDEVGGDASADRIYDTHEQVDLSFSQRLSHNVVAFADVLNLTNEPLRYYFGVPNRPSQQEYYRWWTTVGIRVNY